MTTDTLDRALAFAHGKEHEGSLPVLFVQAKAACIALAKEVERLTAENAELQKRPAGLSEAAIGAARAYDYARAIDAEEAAKAAKDKP